MRSKLRTSWIQKRSALGRSERTYLKFNLRVVVALNASGYHCVDREFIINEF
jgi:hypothetical protein